MDPRDEAYDAIIIGGGPSGATAAVLLAQSGWRVAVVEKTRFPRRKVCGEFISASTWPLLRQLGVAAAAMEIAGPAVRRVGVYAGMPALAADLGPPADAMLCDGRALGREHLDALLLRSAAESGADVWQPFEVTGYVEHDDGYVCSLSNKGARETRELRTRLIIAAHGSWETGPMPTQARRRPPRGSDLFGLKAHFLRSGLPADLMPLLAFPGGYGGMVHTDGGRVSISCCIRRDQLELCRRRRPQMKAGAAVLAHIEESCKDVAMALSSATLDGVWLSAGPLRTGIHSFGRGGVFAVGNAAAEAHPIIAEGISMAIQSATLLCRHLAACPELRGTDPASRANSDGICDRIRQDYARDWRRNFSRRLHLSALFAHLFMRPVTTRLATSLMARFPQLLTLGARWSGKVEALRGARPAASTET